MSADLGELGRAAERRKEQSRRRADGGFHGPRLGVGPSKIGNKLRDMSSVDTNMSEPGSTGEEIPQPLAQVPQPNDPAFHPVDANVVEPLDKATIWLSVADQRFLDHVSHIAHGRTPRISLSRSAITRLAIARLAQQLTAEEIVAALSTPQASAAVGRKRR